jgi:hypothetical protein
MPSRISDRHLQMTHLCYDTFSFVWVGPGEVPGRAFSSIPISSYSLYLPYNDTFLQASQEPMSPDSSTMPGLWSDSYMVLGWDEA